MKLPEEVRFVNTSNISVEIPKESEIAMQEDQTERAQYFEDLKINTEKALKELKNQNEIMRKQVDKHNIEIEQNNKMVAKRYKTSTFIAIIGALIGLGSLVIAIVALCNCSFM